MGVVCIFAAAAIITSVFRDNLVFFFSPTEIKEKSPESFSNRKIRIGGLVEDGSVSQDGMVTSFMMTDLSNSVEVKYSGLLPPMFRAGQGIVAEGFLNEGVFEAKYLLTKHDEKYMPPEVAEALKKSGKWQGENKK